MNDIFFTSDTHFNHENICKLSNRPFQSLEEMTEKYVETWNSQVSNSDRIHHLGDFALSWGKKHAEPVDKILSRLNGQKFLITGNHDRNEVINNRRWVSVRDYCELKIDFGGVHKQRIVMCHYPLRSWNQMHRNGNWSWMLHGHCHGTLKDIGGKIWDVGVDNNNHRPISIDEVKILMDFREPLFVDHHI